jgi:hypothetical protein
MSNPRAAAAPSPRSGRWRVGRKRESGRRAQGAGSPHARWLWGRGGVRRIRQSSMASAVEAALAAFRDAAARHPQRAGAPLAEVARYTAQPGVAAGDRLAGAAARRPVRRAGHGPRTQRGEGKAGAGVRAAAAGRADAAIEGRPCRTSGGRGSRRRRGGGRRAGIRRAGAGPLGHSALSGALCGGFYRAGVESPHWRRLHAALDCAAHREPRLPRTGAGPRVALVDDRLAARFGGHARQARASGGDLFRAGFIAARGRRCCC